MLFTPGLGINRIDDDRLQSISLFAAQADFSEAGEITRFVSASQLSVLEKPMWKEGYLGTAMERADLILCTPST